MLMTLVENAVRHGIDPSLEGGRIEVNVGAPADGRCLAEVRDTGVGPSPPATGPAPACSHRERLQASFEGGRAVAQRRPAPWHAGRDRVPSAFMTAITAPITALIADDEPPLREVHCAACWPGTGPSCSWWRGAQWR